MPLIDTSIELVKASTALKSLGLFQGKDSPKETLKDLLEENSLGADALISSLGSIAHNGESEAIRLRAIETGLKLHPATRQAMKEHDERAIPIVNIVIHGVDGPNPILIPRKVVIEHAPIEK